MNSTRLITFSLFSSSQRHSFMHLKMDRLNAGGNSIASSSRASMSTNKAKQTNELEDGRGYPDRTFTTEVLKIDGERIKFSGKGKEPLRDVLVTIDDAGNEERRSLIKASEALRKGHLVAFPTETVYGLAGNALDPEAATKIFRAKGRPVDNPLIVHISSLSMLERLVPDSYQHSPIYKVLLDAFWPGPLTLLFPADEEKVPSVVRCGLNSLGIRMPSHRVARALIATSNLPLAAPSANVSGKPSPTTSQHVYHDMTSPTKDEEGNEVVSGRIPYIVDGGSSDVGLESTVVDGITEPTELRVLRPGGVTVEAIEDALRQANLLQDDTDGLPVPQTKVKVRVYGRDMAKDSQAEENPTTPGMKYRHYSPEAKVVVLLTSSTEHSSQSASRVLAAKSVGESAARTLLTKNANTVIADEVKQFKLQTGKEQIQVGLMSMDDSKLTSSIIKEDSQALVGEAGSFMRSTKSFEDHTIYRFSLGSSDSPNEAAHRLFDGLRTLDQGDLVASRPSCDLIFVEAVADNFGVGLAIMNRLNKAASQTVLINL